MRRLACVVIAAAVFAVISAIVFAQEPGEMKGSMMERGEKGSMMDREKKMSMHGMMKKKMMMQKSLVATKDGGVIVLIGNKLLKYDKNLNLKKEVTIEIDWESMKKMMMHKKEMCPTSKPAAE